MNQPSILLIYTGGTIGMITSLHTGELKPFDFEKLLSEIPELAKFKIQIDTYTFVQPIDSSNMHPRIWIQLAELIGERYEQYDGFVILHGTDTMSYTASGLSFLLENLSKPVILTGSQLPIGTIRTDGKENLITSIEIAAAESKGLPVISEVAIYFEYKLYRGNRTRKYNAEHFDAFESPNYPVLAEAGVHINFNEVSLAKPAGGSLIVHHELDLNVGILKLFPGISASFVNSVLATPALKGLILETFGSGNAPSCDWLLNSLQAAIQNGLIIVNITQCSAGSVEMGLYETSSGLERIGVISGRDMTTEAAIAKLMYLLATESEPQVVKSRMQIAIAGEMT
jgi:L-asparaginase